MKAPLGIWILSSLAFVSLTARSSDGGAATDFIRQFYQGYLDCPKETRTAYVNSKPFFSSALEALLRDNERHCLAFSRGDDVCGFGADGDLYLNAQETSPKLNFANASFAAKASGNHRVEISVIVWPGKRDGYQRMIQFSWVREASGFRVDDLIYGGNSEGFSAAQSMRQQIFRENTSLERSGRNLRETWSWIKTYLREPFSDRFARFLWFPFEVCEPPGVCALLPRGAAKIEGVTQALHRQLIDNEKKHLTVATRKPEDAFGEKVPADLADGAMVNKGALGFVFREGRWWLRSVNLRDLSETF